MSIAAAGCTSGGDAATARGFAGLFTSDNLNLDVTVESVTIPSDLRPVVRFRATDDAGDPIPLDEFTDIRFILASLQRTSIGKPFEFISYTTGLDDPDGIPNSGDEAVQAGYDSARLGGVTENADGSFTYKFAAALPADYDGSATHQLGGQFRRLSVADGILYRANLAMPFRPDGRPAIETREIVATESCNQCHTRLSIHGNIRREVQLCILCHNTGTADAQTGNSLNFPEMIHKIHRGSDLPSFVLDGEPYRVGHSGGRFSDFSDVEFPQDVRNCTVCHSGAPQASQYEDAPTLEGCAACHDRTWFGPIDKTPPSYTNHVGGEHSDSSLCALCHAPAGNGVSLVDVAHIIPTESDSAPGLTLAITKVSTFAGVADTALKITFTAEDGDAMPVLDLADLDIVAATVAWPVPEYEAFAYENISSGFAGPDGTLVNHGDGSYDYTFLAELPTGSTDTFAVAMEGRREFMFRGDTFKEGTSDNALTLFTLDASIPAGRRLVVDETACSVCHKEIREHGSLRVGVDYCVMCHNPNATDEEERPLADLPPETINFKELIHAIHTGDDLTRDFTVYGRGGDPHDFTHIRFPGDRRKCTICHVEGATSVPLPSEAISTLITQDAGMTVVSETLPTRAACTSCHDDVTTDSHALINTDLVNKVETCSICHSDSDDFSVANVHAIEP